MGPRDRRPAAVSVQYPRDPRAGRRTVRDLVAGEGATAAGARSGAVVSGSWCTASGPRSTPIRAGRVAWQHVVGAFRLEWASDVHPGGPVARASNQVRESIERSASVLPEPDGALFRGLVIGDDRDQPPDMIQRFRASGLSHLTAVSGQNMRVRAGRLRTAARSTPAVGPVGADRGDHRLVRRADALRTVDPASRRDGRSLGDGVRRRSRAAPGSPPRPGGAAPRPGRSVAGVVGRVLALRRGDARVCARSGRGWPIGSTRSVRWRCRWASRSVRRSASWCRAVLVFGRLPLVSIPANLLAVPVAGLVMLYGLPAGLVGGWVPVAAPVVMFPARLGTRWVDTVALLGARLEPSPGWSWLGWGRPRRSHSPAVGPDRTATVAAAVGCPMIVARR